MGCVCSGGSKRKDDIRRYKGMMRESSQASHKIKQPYQRRGQPPRHIYKAGGGGGGIRCSSGGGVKDGGGDMIMMIGIGLQGAAVASMQSDFGILVIVITKLTEGAANSVGGAMSFYVFPKFVEHEK
ncbi:uncharacterized protein G2W53_002355 [Senna tora]|uniref:Uncharacterized protein n=1 Tax=Senna tora TaxID=362788 RepID=A0A834XJ43_9FABA|nr:uncharacterized protein G2W53_002355 [Senna tora]